MAIDRYAYFSRIGYAGRADATLDTLRDVVAAHNRSIPFEHNGLLGYVLDDLGFDVQRLAGQPLSLRPVNKPSQRSGFAPCRALPPAAKIGPKPAVCRTRVTSSTDDGMDVGELETFVLRRVADLRA